MLKISTREEMNVDSIFRPAKGTSPDVEGLLVEKRMLMQYLCQQR
jgi:hypothetical protein